MKFQETGRFGRITKNLRKKGFEKEMPSILCNSTKFPALNKKKQVEYLEEVIEEMTRSIGQKNTDEVLFLCGKQCCGKSWSKFVMDIKAYSESLEDFFINLNTEEEKYNTTIKHYPKEHSVIVTRTKCICGLINKGNQFKKNASYCKCSIGHMSPFFNSVFSVKKISLLKTIFNGDSRCEWKILLEE